MFLEVNDNLISIIDAGNVFWMGSMRDCRHGLLC